MSAIALHEVRVPDIKSSLKKSWELTSTGLLTPASYAADWANVSPNRDLSPTGSYLSSTAKSHEWLAWIQGSTDGSPLNERKIQQIYGQCQLLKNEFSSPLLMSIVSETILVAADYLEYAGWFESPDYKIRLPYQDFLVPGASLLLTCQELIQLYTQYQKTSSEGKRAILFTRMIGQAAKSTLYIIQLVAAYYLYKLSPTVALSLRTVSYFTVLTEVFQTEAKKIRVSPEEQLTYTPDSSRLILV